MKPYHAILHHTTVPMLVKRTVDMTEQIVVSTRIVVRARVMSLFRYENGEFEPSSSANSRTFQG